MFKGSMVALITPMLAGGAIDWDSLDKLVKWHLAAGTDALVILGTTGEAATISRQERSDIITRVVSLVDNQLPVIVGTGANCTALTITLTLEAMQLGANAALVVTPYYNKPPQAGLLAHYQALAKAVPIPLILYNVPSRTGVDLLPATVLEIANTVPSVVGIKDATGDIERLKQMQQLGVELEFYSGDDATALEFIAQGGSGVITVTGNVAPHMFSKMCALQLSGQADMASKLGSQLACLFTGLFIESNPIPTKWLLAKHGHISSDALRLPLVEFSSAGQQQLTAALADNVFE